MAGRVAVFGSLNMDLIIAVPRLPALGETLRAQGLQPAPGGKGLNQAAAARRAGASEVVLIGRLGADAFGAALRQIMVAEGIDQRFVVGDAAGTGVAVVCVDPAGANAIVIVPQGNAAVGEGDADAAGAALADAAARLVAGGADRPGGRPRRGLEPGPGAGARPGHRTPAGHRRLGPAQ